MPFTEEPDGHIDMSNPLNKRVWENNQLRHTLRVLVQSIESCMETNQAELDECEENIGEIKRRMASNRDLRAAAQNLTRQLDIVQDTHEEEQAE